MAYIAVVIALVGFFASFFLNIFYSKKNAFTPPGELGRYYPQQIIYRVAIPVAASFFMLSQHFWFRAHFPGTAFIVTAICYATQFTGAVVIAAHTTHSQLHVGNIVLYVGIVLQLNAFMLVERQCRKGGNERARNAGDEDDKGLVAQEGGGHIHWDHYRLRCLAVLIIDGVSVAMLGIYIATGGSKAFTVSSWVSGLLIIMVWIRYVRLSSNIAFINVRAPAAGNALPLSTPPGNAPYRGTDVYGAPADETDV